MFAAVISTIAPNRLANARRPLLSGDPGTERHHRGNLAELLAEIQAANLSRVAWEEIERVVKQKRDEVAAVQEKLERETKKRGHGSAAAIS